MKKIKNLLESGNVIINWHSAYATPLFGIGDYAKSIPFEFKIKIPLPRKLFGNK
jgi:hypothetical protein